MTDATRRYAVGRFEWEKGLGRDVDKRITAATIAVGARLACYATTTTGGDVRPSQTTVAKEARLHVRTVGKQLDLLVRLGYLEVTEEVDGRPKVYQLTLPVPTPGLVPGAPPASDPVPPASDAATPGLVPGTPGLTPYYLSTTSGLTSPETSPPATGPEVDPDTTPRGLDAWKALEDPDYVAFCELKLQPL